MKKLIGSLAILLAFSTACTEKEVITPYVAMGGSYLNTPDPSGGFWMVSLPDGSVMPSPKRYIVDGDDALFGEVDETRSTLEMSNLVFDPLFLGFRSDVVVKLVDLDGDQLIAIGEVISFQDLSNKSYFHFDGGTGKWEGAEGWMNATGQFDLNGVNTLTALGEVTDPK